ncbi:MAG: GDSL-type esterase/lipase family protein [Candidatus Lernaella stagnicola]|nr:GDSL-type esterase/lipase family protein [Candidatus Lernaella stagnicola]
MSKDKSKVVENSGGLTGKTAETILWFLIFCVIALFFSHSDPRDLFASLRFQPSQGISWYSTSAAVIDQNPEPDAIAEVISANSAAPINIGAAASSLGIDLKAKDLLGDVRRIEDPSGLAMQSFYEALAATARGEKGAITRILHYGDSLVVVDFVTGQARRRLQAQFGDAGHGYMLVGKPWPWYQHWDVSFRTSSSWFVDGIMKPKTRGGYYGLGAYAFDGTGPQQYINFGTSRKGVFGRRAGHFEVHYLQQPNGGSFQVLVDGVAHSTVKTAGTTRKSRVHKVTASDGPHKFRVQCVGDGKVRLFGVVLERDTPGVVYDTLGINGGRMRTLERINPQIWAEQLRLRNPHLVILNFGTNESEDVGRPLPTVENDYLRVLQTVRAAVPQASCLVMAPPDRADRGPNGLTTKPIIPKLVARQRSAALKAGCAFYDTYEAMGGHGAMARWYRTRPRLCAGDMTHPNRRGADVLGDGFFRSLVTGLVQHVGLAMREHDAATASELSVHYDPLLRFQPDRRPPLPDIPRGPM